MNDDHMYCILFILYENVFAHGLATHTYKYNTTQCYDNIEGYDHDVEAATMLRASCVTRIYADFLCGQSSCYASRSLVQDVRFYATRTKVDMTLRNVQRSTDNAMCRTSRSGGLGGDTSTFALYIYIFVATIFSETECWYRMTVE